MQNLKAFILAAGLGERLRPITTHIPKALLPVLGKPVLQHIVERIRELPVNKIGINLHYMAEEIEGWIRGSSYSEMIELFYEPDILGTGGALKNAEAFLKDGIFLIHNSDIITYMDLDRLIEHHLSSDSIATIAVHNCPPFNNLVVDERGNLRGLKSQESRPDPVAVAFTGVAVYSPGFLRFLPGGFCSVVDGWLNAISEGRRIKTLNVDGCVWFDIGTPIAYASAVFERLNEEGERLHIHPSSIGCEHAILDGNVVIEEGCSLGKGVSLKDCIVLPDTTIRDSCSYHNAIIGNDFTVDISGIRRHNGGKILIGSGGSDRRYYRMKHKGGTSVQMEHGGAASDFKRQIEYTVFFKRHSIPVPELLSVNNEQMTAVFEDLGALSLYDWLRCPRDDGVVEGVYKKAIDILLHLHKGVTDNVSECPLLKERIFDFDYFRWESRYFVGEFVKGIRKMDILNADQLNRELDTIAREADSFRKTVIHRDFQSQNIMLKGGRLYIIDYQGARIGPPAYDVASILWDPYYRLKDNIRQGLLDYYINGMKDRIGNDFDVDEFMRSIIICRLQRHMQALGAYAFLSMKKGKRYFLKYIPEGLILLKEDMEIVKDEYKELYRICLLLR